MMSTVLMNLLIATLKPQSNGPSYSNTVIGTLAVDGQAVRYGTARMELGKAAAHPGPSSLYQIIIITDLYSAFRSEDTEALE